MKFREVIKLPKRMLWALVMEGVETSRMVHVYARHGTGKLRIIPKHKKPTPEELKEASEQLKDLPRFLPFFVIVTVPVPGVTEGYALVAVTLEKWLGNKFRLLPSQFREIIESASEDTAEDLGDKATSGKKHLPGA
ncbi:MAG TPA: hypothetical protein VK168_04975 [Saprospiraceae bacterium]|nr:hypothetical protein [Saprospiraceae bacterium]